MTRFYRKEDGFTAAEKALVTCFGLAIVLLAAHLLGAGGERAGNDAARVLAQGAGSLGSGSSLGQPMPPGRLARAEVGASTYHASAPAPAPWQIAMNVAAGTLPWVLPGLAPVAEEAAGGTVAVLGLGSLGIFGISVGIALTGLIVFHKDVGGCDKSGHCDDQADPGANQRVDDVVRDTTPGEKNNPKEVNRHKPGTFEDANRDFDHIAGGDRITDQGDGVRSVELPDGTKVSVRPGSTPSKGGQPTIQINRPDGTVIKIRYDS